MNKIINKENIKIFWLYPDVFNIRGDLGNIRALEYNLASRGLKVSVEKIYIGQRKDISNSDLLYIGGGSPAALDLASQDIISYKQDILRLIQNEKPILGVGEGYYLFGKKIAYRDKNIPTLGIYDFTVVDKGKERACISYIDADIEYLEYKINILGFENHIMQIEGIRSPLATVNLGNGNEKKGKKEGFISKKTVFTNVTGPVLPSNWDFCNLICSLIMNRINPDYDFRNKDFILADRAKEELKNNIYN